MPIFEYECQSCNNVFEKLVMTQKKVDQICSKCKSKKVKKIISNASFKISGYKESNGYSKKAQTGKDIIKKGPQKSIEDMKFNLSH